MTLEELNMMLPDDLKRCVCLNQSQTASILGLSDSTLSNWRAEGVGLEYIKVGKGKKNRVLYPKTAILEWITKTIKTA